MKKETCTWAINRFPRGLKEKYSAYLKANSVTIRDHLEYLIARTLREAGVDIPKFVLMDLVNRITTKAKRQS